jgi:transcriptional regulator with XRE-family HTH domain
MTLHCDLGEERFGERLLRARLRQGDGLRAVANRISEVWPVSFTTLSRFESLQEAPSDARRRAAIALYALAIGYEPAALGLDRSDLPAGLDVEALEHRLVPAESTGRRRRRRDGEKDAPTGTPNLVNRSCFPVTQVAAQILPFERHPRADRCAPRLTVTAA